MHLKLKDDSLIFEKENIVTRELIFVLLIKQPRTTGDKISTCYFHPNPSELQKLHTKISKCSFSISFCTKPQKLHSTLICTASKTSIYIFILSYKKKINSKRLASLLLIKNNHLTSHYLPGVADMYKQYFRQFSPRRFIIFY